MEKAALAFRQLHNSIEARKVDFQLLQNLKEQITATSPSNDDILEFSNLMTEVYQLSNNQKLYQIKRHSISISELAIELKILVCQMMTTIILQYEKQELVNSMPMQILTEAIEIMIVCTRVCLNEGNNKYISLIQQFYKFVHSPFDMVSMTMKKGIKFLHHINVLELIRFKCDHEHFSIAEFQKKLSLIASFDEYNLPEYRHFIEHIVLEILLKSIKNHQIQPQAIKSFHTYLSPESQNDLNCLVFDSQTSIKNIETGSEFLQIYKQVKENGIQSINIQFLQDFIKTEKNFHDQRVFEIAALTREPLILQTWFHLFNAKKPKSPIFQKAILCFIHLIDSIMYRNNSPNQKTQDGILKLSNSVTFAILTEKKTVFANLPVLHIIKTLVKVLHFQCFELNQSWDQIKDFAERIVLLCSRHQSMEVVKVIYSVMLFYCLTKKIKCEDVYQKFCAHHSGEKSSEIFKFLSCAYEVQNSGLNQVGDLRIDETVKAEMRKKPFIAILFAGRNEDMTIFDIEPAQFREVKQKFYIYSQILKKYRADEVNTGKVLNHLVDFLAQTSIGEFQSYINSSEKENIAIQELFLLMIEMFEERESTNCSVRQNPEKRDVENMVDFLEESKQIERSCIDQLNIPTQIGFILINLSIMGNTKIADKLKEAGQGVNFNKYSVKVKMINALTEHIQNGVLELDEDLYSICCSFLITVLEKFKKSTLQNRKIAQPGQISLIHGIAHMVEIAQEIQNRKNIPKDIEIDELPQNSEIFGFKKVQQVAEAKKMKQALIELTIFEINCMTSNWEGYLTVIDKLPMEVLRKYTQSLVVPRSLKQKMFRRMVRLNFSETKCELGLSEFKQIIEGTDDSEEIELYIQYVYSNFGESGRKMIMLMASQNERNQKIILKQKTFQ